MAAKRFVILGTGTDIGKTVVSAALSCWLTERGRSVKYCKPFQTGARETWDSEFLQKHGQCHMTPRVHFWTHSRPASVLECLQFHKARAFTLQDLDGWIKSEILDAIEDVILIEGSGGVLSPILPTFSLLDLALRIPKSEIILVASLKLGTLSHTLTALAALKPVQRLLKGIIFNGEGNLNNISLLQSLTPTPILGRVLYPNQFLSVAQYPEATL
jgi:dethiobiotin synthetase